MSSVIDYIMLGLFVAFMVFVFGGYHQQKFNQREKERLEREKEEKKSDNKE